MMVRNSFRRYKRLGVAALEKPLIRRCIRRGVSNPMRPTQHLNVLFGWRCTCRTSPRLPRIAKAANMAPIAEGQMLALLR